MKQLISAIFLLWGCAQPALGTQYFVNGTTGSDANDCESAGAACETIQAAVNLLAGGDELIIADGTYYENVVIDSLGSSSALPVWIHAATPPVNGSAPTVIVSGALESAATSTLVWTADGGGVYSAVTPRRPLFASYNNGTKDVFLPRHMSLADLTGQVATTTSKNVNMPDGGIFYDTVAGRTRIRLPGGIDPNTENIKLSSAVFLDGVQATNEPIPVIDIRNSPYVIVEGVQIEQSGSTCLDIDQNSMAPTVRNVRFLDCRYGMRLPDNALVEWTEYTYTGWRDLADSIRALNPQVGEKGQFMFEVFKEYHEDSNNPGPKVNWYEGAIADTYGGAGTSANTEFRYNFLHHAFDGESLGNFIQSYSHHNVYLRNYDDHLQMESYAGWPSNNLTVEDSLFLSAGLISHQEFTLIGPQFMNRLISYTMDQDGMENGTIIKMLTPAATGGIYYKDSLLWSHRTLPLASGGVLHDNHPASAEFLSFIGNIFMFVRDRNFPPAPVPGFISDNTVPATKNLLVNDEDTRPWYLGATGEYIGTDPTALVTFARTGEGTPDDLTDDTYSFTPTAHASLVGYEFADGNMGGINWPRQAFSYWTTTAPTRWTAAFTSASTLCN